MLGELQLGVELRPVADAALVKGRRHRGHRRMDFIRLEGFEFNLVLNFSFCFDFFRRRPDESLIMSEIADKV